MKRIFICICILAFTTINIYGQSPQKINKGEISELNGVVISEEDYLKLMAYREKYIAYTNLDTNLKEQGLLKSEIIQLNEEQIEFWKEKYALEKELRIGLQKEITVNKIKIKALTITTTIGFSVAVASASGIGFYYLISQASR